MTEGRPVGPYRLLSQLGQGGMAQVWMAAHQDRPAQRVALKMLLPHAADAASSRRLMEEARIGAALVHPNIVRTLDVGLHGEQLYLVMELLEGVSLSELGVPAPQLPLGLVLALAHQLLDSLAYAHAPQGGRPPVFHRDIKPSNLIVTVGGALKLIDFGIAVAWADDRTTTRTGVFRGSLPYASPEHARNEPADARSDLFSVGLVLHELLTGSRVHTGSEAGIISALLFSPPPPVRDRRPELPAQLDAAVCWALKKERDQRPAGAGALWQALRAATDEPEWEPTRIAQWAQEQRARRPLQAAHAPGTRTFDGPREVVTHPESQPPVPSPRRKGTWAALMGGGVLLVGAGLWALAPRPSPAPAPEAAAPSSPALPIAQEAPPAAPPRPAERAVDVPASSAAPPPEVAPSKKSRRRTERRTEAVKKPAPVGDGFLTVDSRPGWARVQLDGRDLGPTPIVRHRVKAGEHRVEAVHADGARQRRTVTIVEGRNEKLLLTW